MAGLSVTASRRSLASGLPAGPAGELLTQRGGVVRRGRHGGFSDRLAIGDECGSLCTAGGRAPWPGSPAGGGAVCLLSSEVGGRGVGQAGADPGRGDG